MAEKIYNWTDDPMVSGVADCNTDVVNDCLMHLKYENTSDAIQNMYETGRVEKQSRAFNQLLSMKRSTFDKSKFTVVGNPTITDDGVVSGFSQSNYLIAPVKLNLLNSFSAEGSYTYKTKDQESMIWCYNLNCYLSINKSGFFLKYPTGTSSESSTSSYLTIPLIDVGISESDVVHSKVTLSPDKISLTINNIVKELDVNINWGYLQKVASTSGIRLGNANAYQEKYYFAGSIDLKQFSITVDGKEVFSGNKTGIDNIKTDNYEVVGSPVISDDGVASGFNSTSYLFKDSLNIPRSKKVAVELETIYKTYSDGSMLFSFVTDDSIRAQLYEDRLTIWHNDGEKIIESDTLSIKDNDKVKAVISLKSGENTLQLYINDELKSDVSNQNTYNTSGTINAINIGQFYSQYTHGSIDLNSFKIYVDGNLVYQPCLKIPYTRADSKSKIVDVAYRDRVQDVYEQEGLAGYYTIDEENQNFTLPRGEIYGMIEQAKSSTDSKVSKSGDTMTGQLQIDVRPENDTTTPLLLFQKKASDFGASTYGSILFRNSNNEDVGVVGSVENTDGSHRMRLMFKDGSNWVEMPQIIDPYRKGKSGYNIYTNGYCEQWGWIGSGTGTGSVRYNFLKPFANDNFNIEYSIASNDSHTRWANQMSLNGWDVNGFNAMNVGGFGAYWCARGYV